MLWDSHAHLGAPEMLADAADALARARAAGVEGVICVGAGYGLARNAHAVALAEEHADVFATAGLHPHDASEWGELAKRAIAGWLEHARVVAAGECGLDYWYERSPRDAQREALRGQIRLGLAHRKPLVIHARASRGSTDAFEELVRIFDEEGAERAGGVIHCFTGDLRSAREYLARGFAISFSGILTFPNAGDLREVARALPRESLLVETDSPLLAPVPHRGRRNEPAFVVRVAECLAAVHGVPLEAIAKSSAERTRAVFRLGARA